MSGTLGQVKPTAATPPPLAVRRVPPRPGVGLHRSWVCDYEGTDWEWASQLMEDRVVVRSPKRSAHGSRLCSPRRCAAQFHEVPEKVIRITNTPKRRPGIARKRRSTVATTG